MEMMGEKETIKERLSFVVYTALGYLALVLHNSIFAPELAEEPTDVRVVLTMINLAVGTWCFLRALRGIWKANVV